MTLKPVQQANGKRRLKFTKASPAQQSTAQHSPTQPSTASTALHSPVQPCTALVIFSLSFRLPVALARPSLSFRFLFGRLLRLHGPCCLFVHFSVACFALSGTRHLFVLFSFACFACTALVIFSLSFRTCWAPLGSVFAALGPSWLAFCRS